MKAFLLAAVCLLAAGCKSGKVPSAEDLFNDEARVGSVSPADDGWVPLTVSVDRGARTTSTLFGNDEAVKDVRSGAGYEENAALKLVTWRQREDPHWFGGRIPGEVVSVEVVSFGDSGASYGQYAGSPLVKTGGADAAREAAIEGMKVARLP
jgi:hypothetical protein